VPPRKTTAYQRQQSRKPSPELVTSAEEQLGLSLMQRQQLVGALREIEMQYERIVVLYENALPKSPVKQVWVERYNAARAKSAAAQAALVRYIRLTNKSTSTESSGRVVPLRNV
jgi:hypothetical protein